MTMPRIYAVATLLVSAAPLAAQASADSLRIRLQRAEAAIEALQKQIAEQAESGVQSRTRASVEITGRVMMNTFWNSRRVNNVDNPQFVRPDTATGFPARGLGAAMRQTRLGLIVRVPDVLGAKFEGDVDVDFAGGQQPSSGGRTFPLIRLRTARGFMRWSRVELMGGQESPLVSGLNPVSVSAVSTPQFATAGNLWLWLPQARIDVHSAGRVQFGAQGAVLAPTSGDPAGAIETDNDLAERSQRPYVQARAFVRWGEELVREVGCGVHRGWLIPVTTRVSSQAQTCDFLLPVVDWLELRGEAFTGQALRGLGGGGIGRNFTTANRPLSARGGWAQVNFRPTFVWRFGAGCGTDQPESIATSPARRRNDACAAYAMARPAGPLFLGAEFRQMRTRYVTTGYTGNHVTLGAGFEF